MLQNKEVVLQQAHTNKHMAVSNFLVLFRAEMIQLIESRIKNTALKENENNAVINKSEILTITIRSMRAVLQEIDPTYNSISSNSILNIQNNFGYSPYQLILDELLFISKSLLMLNYGTKFQFTSTQGPVLESINKENLTQEERLTKNINTMSNFIIILN